MYHIIQRSCLEKIHPDSFQATESFNEATALVGEEFSYQVILYNDSYFQEVFTVEPTRALPYQLYLADQVAVSYPHHTNLPSKNYLIDCAGILPDRLTPLPLGSKLVIGHRPVVIWVSVRCSRAGKYNCILRFSSERNCLESKLELQLIDCNPPPVSFRYYDYLHINNVAFDYHTTPFTDLFWNNLDEHFDLLHSCGVTDLYTPLYPAFFPKCQVAEPLQLMRVEIIKNKY